MYKALLVFFWGGRLIDYEYASSPHECLATSIIRSAVALLVCVFAATNFPTHTSPGLLASQEIPAQPVVGRDVWLPALVQPSTMNCTDSEVHAVGRALPLAARYVSNALAELDREGPEGVRYRRWFGAPNKQRHATVRSHFEALNRDDLSNYTYVCNPTGCAEYRAEYAFVDYTAQRVINLCPNFFNTSEEGRDSRPSILIHEATHFYRNGFTSDHAREVAGAERLARSFPHLAISNADNYEYFAADADSSALHQEKPPARIIYNLAMSLVKYN
ncbi:hypothetical protein BD414DRAFT_489993 [Trametes punicea]|nr:hypothetical protein BD414DRAFT_489993 [Trametes punicea]